MSVPSSPFSRIRLLGGEVDLVNPADVFDLVEQRLGEGRGCVIANHNLHSLHLIRRDPVMRDFYARADLIEADSTPLIAWGKLLGRPISRAHRCTYLDWREMFWQRAARKRWTVFYLGGEPGVAARGADAIRLRYPGACIVTRDGYFDRAPGSTEASAVLADIAAARPDILFVGMGMPLQERWVMDHLERLPPCAIFTVGAAFDYEAGAVTTPPRWTGRLGVEWLARFLIEPKRLFARYFVEPWSLIGPALGDLKSRA